jgi:hypothetical protein
MGSGDGRKVDRGVSFKAQAEQRSRTPDDLASQTDRVKAARRAAALRSEEARAQRSAEAQAAREKKRRADLAKLTAAASVVENHAAIARQRRIEDSRTGTSTPQKRPRQRKKVRLRLATQEDRIAKIKLEIDRMEDIARACRANFIRHHYRVYRRQRARRMVTAARLVQRCWRGGRERCMLKESLAARTLQTAWRVYAARLAVVRGELMLVSVVRLQRAYFREKRRRCELLYQLAAGAKEAVRTRRARIQAGAVAARRREDAARALAFAEGNARRQDRVKEFRIRRQKVAKRRRILRTAVRLIKVHQEEEERQIVRALEVEHMKRILRKYLRKKLLRRLAAQSFVSERVARCKRDVTACTRTIELALRAAEYTGVRASAQAGHQTASGSRASSRGAHLAASSDGGTFTSLDDAPDTWDWGEGEDIIRSLHLRNVLRTPPPGREETGKDVMSQRRDLAERLERLPSPRQKAVVAMLAKMCPHSVDESAPGKPGELVVDLGQVNEEVLREVRDAISAENAASVWQSSGMAIPRAATASSVSSTRSKFGSLARMKAREKVARRDVSDGETELRRTLRRKFNSLGGTDAHARGMKFPATLYRGHGPGVTTKSREKVSFETSKTGDPRSRPSKIDLELHTQVLRHLELQQIAAATEKVRLQSPYNRRLSPLAKSHDDRMAITQPMVHDNSDWVARQLQHQAPILLGLASSSSPPPSREVDRRALALGMPPAGTLLSYGERAQSPPAYRERRRQEHVDASLLGRIRLSHTMQEKMEQAVCGGKGDLMR